LIEEKEVLDLHEDQDDELGARPTLELLIPLLLEADVTLKYILRSLQRSFPFNSLGIGQLLQLLDSLPVLFFVYLSLLVFLWPLKATTVGGLFLILRRILVDLVLVWLPQ